MADQDFTSLIDDLNRPVHTETLLDRARRYHEGEFAIEPDWQIVLDGECGRRAAAHFAGFLQVSFGLDLPVREARGGTSSAIVLTEDAESFDPRGEAYAINASAERIIVRAGSEPGFWQALIHLEKRMGFVRAPILPELCFTNQPIIDPRIHRSFFSAFYVNDILPPVDPYPDEFLCRLAHYSVNGIWMRATLREVVPSDVFEGLGRDSDRLLGRVNELVERAGCYGIKVYLYMTEPRSFPEGDPFWEKYPHVKGAPDVGPDGAVECALCSSTPEVKEFLRDSSRELFRRAPGLGGLILITASEQHSHCWSHVDRCGSGIDFNVAGLPTEPDCPRCRQRDPVEVVPEIINLIEEGVHSAGPEAKVIAWNWSWTMLEPEPNRGIIRGLSPGVTLMCGFERGGWVSRFGRRSPVDEYSLSYIGPSPRLTGALAVARERGLEVIARLQICATHECATSGYLPLPYNVYEKYQRMREFALGGAMQTWNFGNYPSLPLEVAGWYSWSENNQDLAWLLKGIVRRDYGAAHVDDMIEVFRIVRRAFDYFPIHQALINRNPMNRAPAYPWPLRPTGKPMALSWLHDEELGDSLEGWTGHYGPEVVCKCYEAIAEECEGTLPILDRVEADADLPEAGRAGVAVCRALYHQARSAALLMKFLLVRNSHLGTSKEGVLTAQLRFLVAAEIEHLTQFIPYVERTPILGFHGEALEYLYDADMIREKIEKLEAMLGGTGKEGACAHDSG